MFLHAQTHTKHQFKQDGGLFTPQSGTQDLGVESLLVLADLRRVTLRPGVDRVYVHHGALA